MSRQGVHQAEKRRQIRFEKMSQVRKLVREVRMYLPRLGTRKLHHVLKDEFASQGFESRA